nr:ClassA_beta_lactamase [uncultured bacterium]
MFCSLSSAPKEFVVKAHWHLASYIRHMRLLLLFGVLVSLLSCADSPQPGQQKSSDSVTENTPRESALEAQLLKNVINGKQATVGVAIKNFQSGEEHYILPDERFALMSVAKFPQVLLLLHLADEGKYDPKAPVSFDAEDLKQRTASSLRKDHPQSAFSLPLTEALRYCIGQSDNITSNKIFELEGGPRAVEDYVHSLGIADIGVTTDYAHMRPDSPRQNWGTPRAMLALLEKFHNGKLLSDSSKAMLWKAMVEATSGHNRIRGGVPAGTLVADKTGTSGRDEKTGVTAAFNDVGIVQLPDGGYYGLVVFVGDSKEPDSVNAAIIAGVSKTVWEHFNAAKR